MSMIQIGVIGIAGVLLAIQLKQYKAEYSIYICIALSIFIFFQISEQLQVIIRTMKNLCETISMDFSYIGTLLKMLGITYIAEFASGICKDAGYQTIAVQIEMFSKFTILVLSLPIMLALLETIHSFLS